MKYWGRKHLLSTIMTKYTKHTRNLISLKSSTAVEKKSIESHRSLHHNDLTHWYIFAIILVPPIWFDLNIFLSYKNTIGIRYKFHNLECPFPASYIVIYNKDVLFLVMNTMWLTLQILSTTSWKPVIAGTLLQRKQGNICKSHCSDNVLVWTAGCKHINHLNLQR